MTISSTTRIAGPFVGTGSASVFPFTFKVFAASDLDVIRLNSSTGVETTLVLTTDYTVTLNGNQNTNPGGSVTLVAGALASGFTLTITSDIANLQPTDLTNQGGFYPEVITDSLDRATIQIQQMAEDVGRSVKAPLSDGTVNMELPNATNRAGKYLVFDPNGLPTVSGGSGTDTALRTDLANATVALAGSSLVGFRANDASSTARTVLNKLRDVVSVKDFGAVGDGVTDDTAAITLAIKSNRKILFPKGTYSVSASITFSTLTNFEISGDGPDVSIIKYTNAVFTNHGLDFQNCTNFQVSGITIDQNSNASFNNLFAPIRIVSSSNFNIVKNDFINHTYVGLAIDSVSNFVVDDNYIAKTTQTNGVNYNLNVSSTLSISSQGRITNNRLVNSGVGIVGQQIFIDHNHINGGKYGAGIATFALGAPGTTAPNFYGQYYITNNECLNFNGTDVDGFKCAGMEIAGPYSICSGNSVHNNDGEGIRWFAYQSILANNICYNNGAGLAGTYTQAGITAFFGSASYSCNFSLITGNICFDTGVGTQLYGYAEHSTSLTGIKVFGNDFDNNVTLNQLLLATVGNTYDLTQWISYTPTITSGTGVITLVGACTGRYMERGDIIFFEASCTITTNGTGATSNVITIPKTSASGSGRYVCNGRADAVTGFTLTGVIPPGSNTVTLTTYNAGYPGSNGERIIVSGFYRR